MPLHPLSPREAIRQQPVQRFNRELRELTSSERCGRINARSDQALSSPFFLFLFAIGFD